jgi:tRNA modification GTPase
VEAAIDFPEEDVEFIAHSSLRKFISNLITEINEILRRAPKWERLSEIPRVVLAGRPNAGKSSLMNRLTGLDRSIVSSMAGTTRDVLSAPLKLTSGEVLLQDAAGIFKSPTDAIEFESVKAAKHAFEKADLACCVIDASIEPNPEDIQMFENRKGPSLIVLNKSDLCDEGRLKWYIDWILSRREKPATGKTIRDNVLSCSAETGEGLDELRCRIGVYVHGELAGGSEAALNARHRHALKGASASLNRAALLAEKSQDANELIAMELRDALDKIGEISGQTLTEDILERIFSRFCIGK